MVRSEALWPLVKTAIFTALVPFVVGLWLPYRVHWAYAVPADALGVNPWEPFLSYPFLVVGMAIYLWCAWDFAVTGLGTPAPIDAPRVLIIKGLYRYVRNPMYVGVLCLIASRALFWHSHAVLVYMISIAACFHLFVMAYEEPHLKRVFGEQYEDYCRRVPRWLPRLA